MSPQDRFIVVFITAPGVEEAEAIAERLVEERLAACVNIVPGCRSVYRWEGKIEHDDEVLMVVKSARARFADLEKRVLELHPYDVPEVIAADLTGVSDGYLAFLRDTVG
jgi:periplasmic divalent cation tolerance protein